MARFRHRESGETESGRRTQSPDQIESRDKGWEQVGVGSWILDSDNPGITKALVLEDAKFRAAYEPLDENARVALAAPSPGTMQQTPQPTPAPPDHMAAQALPHQKTAEDYAAERRVTQAAAIAAEEVKAAAAAEAETAGGDAGGTAASDGPEVNLDDPVDPITGEASAAAGGEDLSVEGGGEAAAPEAQAGAETELPAEAPAPEVPKRKGSGRGKKGGKGRK